MNSPTNATFTFLIASVASAIVSGCSAGNADFEEYRDPTFVASNLEHFLEWDFAKFEEAYGAPFVCYTDPYRYGVCVFDYLGWAIKAPPGCTVAEALPRGTVEAGFRNGQMDFMLLYVEGFEATSRTLEEFGLAEPPDRVQQHPLGPTVGIFWDDWKGYNYVAIYLREGRIFGLEANAHGGLDWIIHFHKDRRCDWVTYALEQGDMRAGGVSLIARSSGIDEMEELLGPCHRLDCCPAGPPEVQ